MSTKEVIVYICDNCGAEEEPETGIDHKHPLPKGWIQVTYTTNENWLEEVQICKPCRKAFETALSRRRSK